MMTLRQAKSLLAVVELGTVNRAAEQLCLAPSSVSAQLRELSAGLGVVLFESVGRGLVLSTVGRQLLPKFQHLVAVSQEIAAEAQALTSEPAGQLRLYAPSSICIYRLPVLIEELQRRAPGIELHLQHDPFDYQRSLNDRSIEAAVVVIDKPEPGCDHVPIAREEVVYVTHPALASSGVQDLAWLLSRALITTEPGCSYRVAADQHFRAAGLQLVPRQCFSNVEVVRRCLLAKMGVGLLPRCVVAEDLLAGRLVEQKIHGTPYCFESTVVWPQGATVSPRLQVFLEVVRALSAVSSQGKQA